MRLQFEDVTVDTERHLVTVDGEPVHLSPRAFRTLSVLVEHAGQPVSRDDLLTAVWPETHVVRNSASQAVRAVRRALKGSRGSACIRALPSRGYVLAATVEELPEVVESLRRDGRSIRRLSGRAWTRWAAVCALALAVTIRWETRSTLRPTPRPESEALETAAAELMATRRGPDLRAAIALLSRSVQKDPQNARAFAGLAQANYLAGFYGVDDRTLASSRAVDAASHAIALDPQMARAYVVRASIALDADWNLAASADDFRRALQIDPGDPLVQHWSAWWCLAANRMADARAAIDRAVRLDPFSPSALTARATFAYLDGDYDAAIADSRRALQATPGFFRAYLRIGLTHLARGRTAEALPSLMAARRLAPDVPETTSALAHAYLASGMRSEGERILAESREQLPLYDQAIVLTGLGRFEEAARTLQHARDRRQLDAGLFAAEPRLAPLRAMPGFRRLVAAVSASAVIPTLPDWSLQRPGPTR